MSYNTKREIPFKGSADYRRAVDELWKWADSRQQLPAKKTDLEKRTEILNPEKKR